MRELYWSSSSIPVLINNGVVTTKKSIPSSMMNAPFLNRCPSVSLSLPCMRCVCVCGCVGVCQCTWALWDRLQSRGELARCPGLRGRGGRWRWWRRCVFTEWHSSCSPRSFLDSFDLGNLAQARSLWRLSASLWSSPRAVWELLALHCHVENGPGRWVSGCWDCWLVPPPSPLASCHRHVWRCLPPSR